MTCASIEAQSQESVHVLDAFEAHKMTSCFTARTNDDGSFGPKSRMSIGSTADTAASALG